ncbi:SMAD/FHA domain-containing protein [Suillus variegatus]|nr:SMAD/FHA domain-containing protein [Suillus variegatus]
MALTIIYLTAVSSDGPDSTLLLSRVKIGRQTSAKTIPGERNGYFDSMLLSRQHAEIWEDSGKIYIKDVKSSNGTFINGERLSPEGVESEPFELKNDDIVEFGIDIIGEDNKTTIHHKVAARVMCVFTDEDAHLGAR